jgi:flagellar protein FlaJ
MMFFFFLWPASAYWEGVESKKNEIEEKFPDFLRDLAEYWKGGLSMTVAVQTLATSEYGALNDEVKKMSDQLSWGIKFSDVILQFAERVGTPLVKRAISLISEADRAGGKISDILVTAANDSREIKFLEAERKRAIGSYIAVIWTSYFVFLGVIVVLSTVFIPAIAGSNSGDEGGESIGNMKIRNVDPLFFLTIFYYGVTMQAIGNGCMAGLMATGRFSAGFKHSGMMILVALVVFNVIAFSPELIGITGLPTLNPSIGTFVPAPLAGG